MRKIPESHHQHALVKKDTRAQGRSASKTRKFVKRSAIKTRFASTPSVFAMLASMEMEKHAKNVGKIV